MGLVAPSFILLAQALDEGLTPKGARRGAGALVGFTFLVAVQAHTGVMLLVMALGWVLLRYGQRLLAALAGAVALYLALDFEVLRQAQLYFSHPIFGNGFSQEGGDSLLEGIPDGLRVLPHPNNILLAVIHSTGLIGLVLFLAAWAVPAWNLPDSDQKHREGAVFLVSLLPGLLTMLSAGAYLLVPFHPSWMCLWLPLGLMLASLSARDTRLPPLR